MPRDDTRPKKIFIKSTGPKKMPPMPDYGGKPPGAKPLGAKPTKDQRDKTLNTYYVPKGPRKAPPRPDYGGKPPGAKPIGPKPE